MEKNRKNGEMTLDKLARIMANSFGEAKQELRNFKLEVNDRFNRVENQLEKIEENSYDQVNTNEKTDREIIKLKQRVGMLENKVIRKAT